VRLPAACLTRWPPPPLLHPRRPLRGRVDDPISQATTTRMSCSTTMTVLPAFEGAELKQELLSRRVKAGGGLIKTYNVLPRPMRCNSGGELDALNFAPLSSVAGWPGRRWPGHLAQHREGSAVDGGAHGKKRTPRRHPQSEPELRQCFRGDFRVGQRAPWRLGQGAYTLSRNNIPHEALALAVPQLGHVGREAAGIVAALWPPAWRRTTCARGRTSQCRWPCWSAAMRPMGSGRRASACCCSGDVAAERGQRGRGRSGFLFSDAISWPRLSATNSTSTWLTRLDLPRTDARNGERTAKRYGQVFEVVAGPRPASFSQPVGVRGSLSGARAGASKRNWRVWD
jgi:hypothetical protein